MDILSFMNKQMGILAIPYEFVEWTDDEMPNQYWIGECSESPTFTEDGHEEYSFILTGTTRGKWIDLVESKEKIKAHFEPVYGLRTEENGDTFFAIYSDFSPIPTGEADLKRMQINIDIKVWKGMK